MKFIYEIQSSQSHVHFGDLPEEDLDKPDEPGPSKPTKRTAAPEEGEQVPEIKELTPEEEEQRLKTL